MHNETAQLRNPVHTKAYPCVGLHHDDMAIYSWHAFQIKAMAITLWSLQGCLDLILCLFHLLGVALLALL